jgi:hypothetical protein
MTVSLFNELGQSNKLEISRMQGALSISRIYRIIGIKLDAFNFAVIYAFHIHTAVVHLKPLNRVGSGTWNRDSRGEL